MKLLCKLFGHNWRQGIKVQHTAEEYLCYAVYVKNVCVGCGLSEITIKKSVVNVGAQDDKENN